MRRLEVWTNLRARRLCAA